MDRQHEKIFQDMLAIEDSLVKKDPWHIVHFQILELERSMSFHFAVEDSLLEVIRYPEAAQHHASHERLIAAMRDFEKKVKDSRSVNDLVVFFEDWFVSHVLSEDKVFVDYASKCMERFATSDI
jgi:hemerythrin-like metal-binding protein